MPSPAAAVTPTERLPSPASVGGPALWRTNPVWCVERFRQQWHETAEGWRLLPLVLPRIIAALGQAGLRLPRQALREWQMVAPKFEFPEPPPAAPGVVGLLVDRTTRAAWVTPLRVRAADRWSIEPHLPLRVEVVQDLLVQLIQSAGIQIGGAIPERLAFAFDDLLGCRADGSSLDVAALLAVLCEINGQPPLLQRACALVQPGPGGRLVSVGSVGRKLAAFVREYESGTLLVRAGDCVEGAAYDRYFTTVWQVDSFGELAHHAAALLPALCRVVPLDRPGWETSLGYLQALQEAHRYGDVLSLAQRLLHCPGEGSTGEQRGQVRRTLREVYRHLGYYAESVNLASEDATAARESSASSYSERLAADTVLAASFYDPHRFDDAERVLRPWCERLAVDPLIVQPEERVMAFNTLARVLTAQGRAGWRELFAESQRVQTARHGRAAPRTLNYLAHSLLRADEWDEAEAVLTQVAEYPLDAMSRWMLAFYRADLARRRGALWSDPDLDQCSPTSCPVGHPLGFYFQATARQPGRTPAEAQARFSRARDFFLLDRRGAHHPNIADFLAACMQLAVAVSGTDASWDRARAELLEQLVPRPDCQLASFYQATAAALGPVPDAAQVAQLLTRIPWF